MNYWESENRTQANAQLAWTGLSFFAGGAGAARASTMSFRGFGTAAAPARALQFEQYALRAERSGLYPVMQRGSAEPVGSVFLKEGDVWKFGETMNPSSRYSGAFLRDTGNGLRFDSQFTTPSFKTVLQVERQQILGYEQQFGKLPPGNKIRR